jgi:hypothetical protein
MAKAARKPKPLPLELLTGQALVDAIAADVDDGYDCIELEAMHRAQRLAKFRRIAIRGLASLLVQDRHACGERR